MAAADSNSGNAIVDYLNERKKDNLDYGRFLQVGEPFNVGVEVEKKVVSEATAGDSEYTAVYKANKQKYTYDAMTQAIKKTLKIENETIKLIILELIGNTLTLDCNEFLLDKERMQYKGYFNGLNHVIVGKIDENSYAVIGYIEIVKQEGRLPRVVSSSEICRTFKLTHTNDKCALLPETIKNIIFQCITQHYIGENKEPDSMVKYYNPTTKEYKKEVEKENVEDAQKAAAQAAAEVKGEDICDFKTLLKSKIKNESNEYCKVTDPGLLERIKQNIDGDGVDVNVDGLNELINTRIKKVTDEGEEEEDEAENEREDGKKTISENKEATMIREANEMFMISRKVSNEISKGATYSSSDFFKQYLPANTMVNEQEEKEPENPVAAPTVIEATAATTEAPVATTGAPVIETASAAATTTEATAPVTEGATAPDATAAPASVTASTQDKLKTATTAVMAIVKAKSDATK